MTVSALVFVVLGVFSPGLHWTGAETEVYRPLVSGEVAIDQSGHLFIVQRDEASVLRLEPGGEKAATFGRRGEGPGEFQIPTWIHADSEMLYIEDVASRSISAFRFDGKFVKRLQLPAADLAVVKVKGGWVYGDWDSSHDESKDVNLVRVDEAFQNPKKLLSWPRLENISNVQVRTDGRSKPKIPINPAPAGCHLAAHPNGDIVFLVKQGAKSVTVIDAASGKIVTEKETGRTAIPFNTRWGEAYLAGFVEGQSETMRAMIDFVGQYPDTFPVVRRMRCLPSGLLLVEYWTNQPDKKVSIDAFDAQMKPVDLGLNSDTLARLIHIDGDKIWLTHYDNENENGSVVCMTKEAGNGFVAGHPIVYQGLTGEDIVIERH